jgi:hypothetical protein
MGRPFYTPSDAVIATRDALLAKIAELEGEERYRVFGEGVPGRPIRVLEAERSALARRLVECCANSPAGHRFEAEGPELICSVCKHSQPRWATHLLDDRLLDAAVRHQRNPSWR